MALQYSMEMKTLLVLCFALVVLAQDKYYKVNDNFNVDELLNNDRLLLSYSRCLLDKGPCTSEVKRLKDKIPEVLESNCSKCTDRQREIGTKLAREMKANHPELWSQFVSKYDPEGRYQKSFEKFLQS